MRHLYLLSTALLVFLLNTLSFAEGTRELAPNPQIDIMGNLTNDIAAMYIDNVRYNNFAAYNNPNPLSRLHVNIQDPGNECIYLGFSQGTFNGGAIMNFEYRVLDPNGNVIFGPIQITPADAQINGWADGSVGPQQLYGPTGYDATFIPSSVLTSQGWSGEGNYWIEFTSISGGTVGEGFLIDYWDITVADCSGASPAERKGRVWSNNWALFAINDFGFPNRPFNGAFYVCAPDPDNPDASFITRVDFDQSGFRPGGFNVAFNSFGILNTGNIAEDRKSVEMVNSAIPEYEIFLNDPIDICETAELGEVDLIGVSRCSIDDFCIKFATTREGQLDLLLDFDGPDGMYTPGTADVLIPTNIGPNQVNKATCLDWDGRDGLGSRLPETSSTEIPIVISYAQGIYHFPIYDAELLTEGLRVEAVRPAGPSPLLFYDDSNISTPSGTGEPQVQLNGCTLPCHGWTTYINPGTMGFGNLNTINSWWFSQQQITQEVFNLPGYLECLVSGTEELCPGDTGVLKVELVVFPPDADLNDLTIISREWCGSGIVGSREGDSILVTEPIDYPVRITYLNATGDTCATECDFEISPGEQTTVFIDTLIVKGDVVTINNETYTDAGRYSQLISSTEGCDTLLIIDVILEQTTLYYDFNDCRSYQSDSTHQDYSEFTVQYPDPLSCADIESDFVRREPPVPNPHSCTPGVEDSPAVCVSSKDTCDFVAGDEKALIFEVDIEPAPDTAVLVTSLSFFERAPEQFDWIDGPDGPNNYPTLYGIRILKNGTEVFRQEDIPTEPNWNEEVFDLSDLPEMKITETATLRFEFLGYCLIGDTSSVAAWDMDELRVNMACASPNAFQPEVKGLVQTVDGRIMPNIDITLTSDTFFGRSQETSTDANGEFAFMSLLDGRYLDATGPDDYLNGISTRDVILLKRYILGRMDWPRPEALLASDCNADGRISIQDVTGLHKVVLGRTSRWKNESWLFGQVVLDPETGSPFLTSPQRVHAFEENVITGIKVGDMDLSAEVGGLGNNLPRGNGITMTIQDQWVDAGQSVMIPVYQETAVEGGQIEMSFSGLSATDIQVGSWDLSKKHWMIRDESVRISYDQESLSGGVAFAIIAVAERPGFISDMIELNSGYDQEVYLGEELSVSEVHLQFSVAEEDQWIVFPNPSAGEVTISGPGVPDLVEIHTIYGQLIMSGQLSTLDLDKGTYLLKIKKDGRQWMKKVVVR
jgi:hypothetical protein